MKKKKNLLINLKHWETSSLILKFKTVTTTLSRIMCHFSCFSYTLSLMYLNFLNDRENKRIAVATCLTLWLFNVSLLNIAGDPDMACNPWAWWNTKNCISATLTTTTNNYDYYYYYFIERVKKDKQHSRHNTGTSSNHIT